MSEKSEFLSNLNNQQIPAVKHFTGPALVVAGPGSGKTRVLTHRVAYLIKEKDIGAENILAVTFTNKAAQEIKIRVNELLAQKVDTNSNFRTNSALKLPWSGTFHSICSKILRKDGFKIGIPPSYVIYDTADQRSLIKQIIKDFGMNPKQINYKGVLATISNAKSELITPQEYSGYAKGLFQKSAAKIYPEYQKRLRANNALDFDDLLVETVKLFDTEQQTLEKYQNQLPFILVDEYQDTNKAQYVLTKLLAQAYRNLYVVGDMSQAIYSFRGADYRNILNFERDYPDAKIYNLERNYRSTQNILDAATNVIKNNSSHIALDLWTEKGAGEKIVIYTGINEKDEASYVVNQIEQELTAGRELKDIAVLYRTNAQSRNMEEFLIKSHIPYKIVGGLRFYDRKEVKDIIAFLRVVANQKDTVSWERIINIPPRGIGDKSKDALKQSGWDISLVEEKSKLPFSKWIKDKDIFSTSELMEEILEETGYIKWLDDGSEENKARVENIKELKTVATNFTELEEFLENVTLIESSNKPNVDDEQEAITLMTIHASKGLEFPVVYLIGVEEGLFPHTNSMMELSELEEERRLCYVAITRAMEKIHMTNARSRMYFGNIQSNLPSRFISEIPQELVDLQGNGSQGYFDNKSGRSGRFSKSTEDFLDELDFSRNNFSWE